MTLPELSAVSDPVSLGRFRTEQTRALCLYIFMIYAPAALFFSFFPLYYKDIGYSDALYGMQNALLPIVGMVGNYLFGYLSDRWSRMKPIILVLLLVIMVLMYLIFQTQQVFIVMGLVLLFQFIWVPVSTLTDSMAMISAKRLERTYATIRGFGAAGFAIAALLIGWLLERWPGPATMGWIGVVTVALTWLMLLPIRDPRLESYGPKEELKSQADSSKRERVKMKDMWKYVLTKPFIWFMGTLVVFQMSASFNDQYFSYMIREMNGTQFHIGMGWMLPAAIEVFIFLYIGRGMHNFRPLPMLAIAAAIMAVRGFVLAWTDSLVVVMIMQAIQGISIAFFFIYMAEYMMQLIPDRFRASGQALQYLIVSIGATMTGSLIGAYLYANVGIKGLFITNGVLLVVATVGFLLGDRIDRYHDNFAKE